MKKLLLFVAVLLLTPAAFAQLSAPTFNWSGVQNPSTFEWSAYAYVGFDNPNSGGAICYTTDGSTPTAPVAGTCSGGTTQTYPASALGTNAIYVYVTGSSVNAIATEVGQTNSAMVTTGPILIQVAQPVFSINTGTYTYALSVVLSAPLGANAPQTGYVICYTTDGTTPTAPTPGTCSGGTTQTYTTPISIASGSSEAINALITQTTTINSNIAAQVYSVIATRSPITWYIRTDGGTRYSNSINTPSGQCNGMYNASYASTGGTGINQNCAFSDVRYLWADGSYTTGYNNATTTSIFPGWGWVIAGGDTVIIEGSISTSVSYRVGWNNNSNSYDGPTNQYWGKAGDPFGSGAPPPPSGTSSQHTELYGQNHGSCHAANAKTQLHGGYGAGDVLSMAGASYVDVSCLDITDFSNCGLQGQSVGCNKDTGTLSDYASTGIQWYNTSTYDTLTDVHIHGLAQNGMNGATGTGTVFSYLDVIANASSGWNSDDSSGSSGTGTLLVQNFNVGWNGCTEEYPIVDPLPYFDCTDDVTTPVAGYGDGFGTATVLTTGWQLHWDQGNVFYNTQDGLDQLHVVGPGSSTTVTRVLAYGNMGQQLKIGGQASIIQNSVIVGNCNAMRQAIPGTPAGYNSSLSDFCRAADTGILISVNDGTTSLFQNNTFYSANATALEINTGVTCTTSTCLINYDNNIFVGFIGNIANGYLSGAGSGNYSNPVYTNDAGGQFAFNNPGSSYSNNITFNPKGGWTCPATWLNETNALCNIDPQLVDETWHNYSFGDMSPASSGSAAKGAGMYLSGLTTDYIGATRANPPSIGAYESYTVQTLTSITVTPSSGSVTVGSTTPFSAICNYSSGSYIPCTVTWTDTNVHSSISSTTGVVTGVSIGTDTITATISTIFGTATVTVTAAPPPAGWLQGPFVLSGRAVIH